MPVPIPAVLAPVIKTASYNDTIRCEGFPEVANFTEEEIREETMRQDEAIFEDPASPQFRCMHAAVLLWPCRPLYLAYICLIYGQY